eukprot:Rhum_TRINITY_DN14389_c0_g2::Rhum_TRINITY_DN14389_c0_g2_i2::g.84309::m.84309
MNLSWPGKAAARPVASWLADPKASPRPPRRRKPTPAPKPARAQPPQTLGDVHTDGDLALHLDRTYRSLRGAVATHKGSNAVWRRGLQTFEDFKRKGVSGEESALVVATLLAGARRWHALARFVEQHFDPAALPPKLTVTLISAHGKDGDLPTCEQLFAKGVEALRERPNSLQRSLHYTDLVATLAAAYRKAGRLAQARALLDAPRTPGMPGLRETVVVRALRVGLAATGAEAMALVCAHTKAPPTEGLLHGLLDACRRCGDVETADAAVQKYRSLMTAELHELHLAVVAAGDGPRYVEDMLAALDAGRLSPRGCRSAVVWCAGRSRADGRGDGSVLRAALRVFAHSAASDRNGGARHPVLWEAMLEVLLGCGRIAEAAQLGESMKENGVLIRREAAPLLREAGCPLEEGFKVQPPSPQDRV